MANKEWTGYVSGDWNNGDNWDNYDGGGGSGVPTNGDDVSMYFAINYGCVTGPSSPVTLASAYLDVGGVGATIPDMSLVSTTGYVDVEGQPIPWHSSGGNWQFNVIGGTFYVGPGYTGGTGGVCTSAASGYLYGGGDTAILGGTYGSVICDGQSGYNDCEMADSTITGNLTLTNYCVFHQNYNTSVGGVVTIESGSEFEIATISGASRLELYGTVNGGELPATTNAYYGATLFSAYGPLIVGATLNVYGNIYFGSGYGTYGMSAVNILAPRCVLTMYWEGIEWVTNYFPSVFGIT